MAKIVLSDAAPEDAVHFSLGQFEIDVPHDTRNRDLISDAVAHPWLNVEYDEVEVLGGEGPSTANLANDPLAAGNDVSNDPEAVQAELDRREAEKAPLAVDAALDQDEPQTAGPVAITLAADDDDHRYDAGEER